MEELLRQRAAELSQLAATARTGPAPRFVPFATCPAIVKAMLVSQSARMLDCFIRDVRLLG